MFYYLSQYLFPRIKQREHLRRNHVVSVIFAVLFHMFPQNPDSPPWLWSPSNGFRCSVWGSLHWRHWYCQNILQGLTRKHCEHGRTARVNPLVHRPSQWFLERCIDRSNRGSPCCPQSPLQCQGSLLEAETTELGSYLSSPPSGGGSRSFCGHTCGRRSPWESRSRLPRRIHPGLRILHPSPSENPTSQPPEFPWQLKSRQLLPKWAPKFQRDNFLHHHWWGWSAGFQVCHQRSKGHQLLVGTASAKARCNSKSLAALVSWPHEEQGPIENCIKKIYFSGARIRATTCPSHAFWRLPNGFIHVYPLQNDARPLDLINFYPVFGHLRI